MRLWQAAGLPDGVINLVYGPGAEIGDAALASPDLAGIHFTGSTGVFNGMWRTVAGNMEPLPQLPADRRRDGRQGLHRRPPLGRRRRARGRGRARLVRVPGAEVLGRLARLRAVEPLAGAARAARRGGRDDQGGRRRRLRQLHGRRDRRRLVRDAGARRSRRRARTRGPRSSSAAAPTTRRASSSSRP